MLGTVWRYIKETFSDFIADNALSKGAAISFYTILSVGPLLVLCIAIAGIAFGQDAARGAIEGQLQGLMGEQAAGVVQSMVASAGRQHNGFWATALAVASLLITASGAFGELQADLNAIWKAEPQAGLGALLKARATGLGLVATLGFLLIVSLVIGALLEAFGAYVIGIVPEAKLLLQIANIVVSFVIISALFTAIYKILPDRKLKWGDVVVGALVTALLFTIGRTLIAYYIGVASVANSYGAAGTIIVVLLWIYYSCEIFLLGAEFTKVWAAHHGSREAFEAHVLTAAEPGAKTVVVHPPRQRIGLFEIAALGALVLAIRSGDRRSGWF